MNETSTSQDLPEIFGPLYRPGVPTAEIFDRYVRQGHVFGRWYVVTIPVGYIKLEKAAYAFLALALRGHAWALHHLTWHSRGTVEGRDCWQFAYCRPEEAGQ